MSALPENPEPKVRVMILDGESAARQALTRQLTDTGVVDVVGTAINARTALAKLQAYRPDVVTVDLVTADADGIAFVQELRRLGVPMGLVLMAPDVDTAAALQAKVELQPCEVLLRQTVVEAPVGQQPSALAVFAAAGRKGRAPRRSTSSTASPTGAVALASPPAATTRKRRPATPEIVGIGTSTGGPNALAKVLPMLPADFPLPVLIVQHMPAGFTASLAQSLTRVCKLPVREAVDGEQVRAGQILIAPGGKHMRVEREEQRVTIRLSEDPPEHSCRPAVDYLFRSLCRVYAANTVAVIMTGMGEDGFAGCRDLHATGAWIVAQDEASCTVFGMPRGPIETGIADTVAPLDQLALRICELATPRTLR